MMYIKLTRPITGAVVDLLNEQLSVRYDCARQTVPGTANSFWQLTIRDSLTDHEKIQLIDLLEPFIPDFERKRLRALDNSERKRLR